MLAFEVSVNGKVVYTMGVGERGMLNVDLAWICIDRKSVGDTHEESFLWGSGAEGSDGGHLRWPKVDIKRGDEITIRLVERDTFDPGESVSLSEMPEEDMD